MKKILYFVAVLTATAFITTTNTSCKYAPDQHDGDTVAASEFYPEDTTAAHAKKMAKIAAIKASKDSRHILCRKRFHQRPDSACLLPFPS